MRLKKTRWIAGGVFVALLLVRAVGGCVMDARLNDRLDAMRRAGEPVTLVEMAPPEIPDEENAAVIYERAFRELDRLPKEWHGRFKMLRKKADVLEGEDVDAARQVLKEAEGALRLIREAAERPKCRFPVDYTVAPAYAHLSQVKACYRLLMLSSRVHAADGRFEKAAQDCTAMLQVAHSLHDEPLVLSMLVEAEAKGIALRQLQMVLDRWVPSAERLRELKTA